MVTKTQEISEQIEDYLTDCRARGLAVKTVEGNYGYVLRRILLPWCQANGIADAQSLDQRALNRWQTSMLDAPGARGRTLSRFSVDTYVRAINGFLAWARGEGEVTHAGKGKRPQLPRKLLDVLSRDEIDLMEDVARNERDKLIVRLLADTGIRNGELLQLRASDLVERDRQHFLRIQGKGARERMVPIPGLWRRLSKFARVRPAGRLFLGNRRQPGRSELTPLTASGLQQVIRNLAIEAGITKRVYPHLMRHSWATWALRQKVNPLQVASVLGHSNLSMLAKHYSQLDSSDSHDMMAALLARED